MKWQRPTVDSWDGTPWQALGHRHLQCAAGWLVRRADELDDHVERLAIQGASDRVFVMALENFLFCRERARRATEELRRRGLRPRNDWVL